jgi:UPF0755 protein
MLETLSRRSERPPPKERRRGPWILLIVFIVLVGSVAVAGGWWARAVGSCGDGAGCPHTRLVIDIPPGSSGADVADILKENGVIRSTMAFKLMAKFRARGGFDAGTYTNLTTNMTVSEALDALKLGPLPQQSLKLLIREGLNVKQTAAAIQDALGVRIKDFVSAATSGDFSLPPYLPQGTNTVEGFLFPNTYDFFAGSAPKDIIDKLLKEFRTQVADLPWDTYKRAGITSEYDVIIVASMIEREAKFDEDRAKIARVIYNRLKKGMPLEIDATVQYALNKYAPLTTDDLNVDSPYNTYKITGLPPTPIASPSLASIAAALSPANGKWLYYLVTSCDGHHTFTSSYDEFINLKNSAPSC